MWLHPTLSRLLSTSLVMSIEKTRADANKIEDSHRPDNLIWLWPKIKENPYPFIDLHVTVRFPGY